MEVVYFLIFSYLFVMCHSLKQGAQSNEVTDSKDISLVKATIVTNLQRYERNTKKKKQRHNRKVKTKSRSKKNQKRKTKQTQGRKKDKKMLQRKQKSHQQRQTGRRRRLRVGAARGARGPLLGDICQFVDFTASRSQGSGCQDGAKIVIRGRTKSVRKQFLISAGRTIYGFVAKRGGKFGECGCATDISPTSQCKPVSGLGAVTLKDSVVQARTQQRAPLKGSSCQWLDLDRVRLEGQGCQDGAKFVLNKDQGVRKQLLYVEGRSVVAFIQNGLKFADCQLYTDVTANVQCKVVTGVEGVSLSSSCASPAAPVTEGSAKCSKCGERTARRIVGGQAAETNEYPWMALLRRKGTAQSSFFCGGALVNDRWVITAAHCLITTAENMEVRLGEHIRSSTSESLITKDFLVSQVIVHESYQQGGQDANDIGLLLLSSPASLSVFTPVCLPALQDYLGRETTVIGWGSTNQNRENSRDTTEQRISNTLKELNGLVVKSDSDCSTALGGGVTADMLCAGGEQGKDACQGDSGGPLMYLAGQQMELVGVVSWGKGCARPGLPGVYAEVSMFSSWLASKMGSDYSTCDGGEKVEPTN